MKFGEKQVMNYTLRGVPQIFRKFIWRLGGRKIAEKSLQKTFTKAIPILGAIVGGSVDWYIISKTGKVANEYYQMGGPIFLEEIGNMLYPD